MALAHRTFPNYENYVFEQGGKAHRLREFLLEHLPKQTESFARTFRHAAPYLKPGAVLCLGARTGAESLGAVEAGFKGSVGIDLHPVGPTVQQGDWHDLRFPIASFANVYTNSLDHCLYLDLFAAQVKRVLEGTGRFYLMATNRPGKTADEWLATFSNEAMFWETSDQLSEALVGYGFDLRHSWRTGKWGHYIFGVR